MSHSPLLNRKQAAETLQISLSTLDKLLTRPENPIPSIHIGRRVLIRQLDLDSWLSREVV